MTEARKPYRAPTGEEIVHAGFAAAEPDGVVRTAFQRPTVSRRVALTNVPVFVGEQEGDDSRAIGSPGAYEVTFVLSAPGNEAFLTKMDVKEFLDSGYSLMQLPPGARGATVRLEGQTPATGLTILPNASGLVGSAVVTLHAATFADAERDAHDMLAPMLSWWSYRYDVPIDLKGWMVYERATTITRFRFGVLARAVPTEDNRYVSKPELRYVLSAYREGMNAVNAMYQACCFYRVIEGARRLRARRRTAAGTAFREPTNEVMPTGAALATLNFHDRAAIRPYAGRSFGYVRDQLRELVRNAASHLDPTGEQETLMADQLADVTRCEDASLVLKHVARVMLDNEFRADPDLGPLL